MNAELWTRWSVGGLECFGSGAPDRTRTDDLRFRNPLNLVGDGTTWYYQLSVSFLKSEDSLPGSSAQVGVLAHPTGEQRVGRARRLFLSVRLRFPQTRRGGPQTWAA